MKERWEWLEHPSRRLGPQKRRWGVLSLGKTQIKFGFPLVYSSFAAPRRRYSRSGKQKNLRFFLLSARLFVLCRSAAKVLSLGKAKKSAIFFAFRSLIRPLPLRGEGTLARESKKICDFFCFPLAYSSFAAPRRRYSRSGKQKNLRFFLLSARLFVPLHLKNRVALCMD